MVVRADAAQGVEAVGAVAGVDDQLGEGTGVRSLQQTDVGVLGGPLGVGHGAERVGLRAGERRLDVAGADDNLVAEPRETRGEHAADHASSDDGGLHDDS